MQTRNHKIYHVADWVRPGAQGSVPWSTVVALPVGRTWWCSASVERTDVTRDYAASSITRRCCCSRSADMGGASRRGAAGGSVGTNSISTSSARHGRAGPSLAGRRAEQTSRAGHFLRGASVGDDLWGRSRSGPLAPNRRWSRMGAMRGRARSAAAERRRGAAPTATCALGGRGAAICAPR